MTREEALRELMDIRDEATAYPDAVCYVTSEDEDALNMAITALNIVIDFENDAVKTEDDVIKRQGAVETVKELNRIVNEDRNGTVCTLDVLSRIEKLPSAEPKTGEWKSTTSGDHYKCSVCGYRAGYWFNEENSCEYSMDMSEWLSNFCPNCGAKMKGADDEREDIQSTDE